ncbi:hypothetical protein KUTeg_021146 [Tegillarca granosa]|uniref:Uncharacterized protein n=1 Tax=Tegillarca granosa TaxID=220873 RepID=A0ABQ9ECD0_TEGGR|nr:hypothetical protein KUTeg_021146 [Tegillarca granosa]
MDEAHAILKYIYNSVNFYHSKKKKRRRTFFHLSLFIKLKSCGFILFNGSSFIVTDLFGISNLDFFNNDLIEILIIFLGLKNPILILLTKTYFSSRKEITLLFLIYLLINSYKTSYVDSVFILSVREQVHLLYSDDILHQNIFYIDKFMFKHFYLEYNFFVQILWSLYNVFFKDLGYLPEKIGSVFNFLSTETEKKFNI